MAAAEEKVLPPVDKVSLNNEIVHLRPTAKNAKINFIRKLVKEIKTLKVEKSGIPEKIQLEKNARAEKLTEEMKIAKTIDKDDITVAVLSYSPAEVTKLLKKPMASAKGRILLKISSSKVIVTGVQKMLSKYEPITHAALEKVVSSIGVKKKRRKPRMPTTLSGANLESIRSFTGENDNSEDSQDSEESDADEEWDGETVSTKKTKKAKRSENIAVGTSSDEDSETEDVELARMKKKAKHLKNLSKDMSAETDSETEEVELARMKKKAKHLKNLSKDMSAETDSETEEVELARMKKKAKHLKNLSQDMSAETDSEAEDVELARMKKKAKHLKNLSQDMSAETDSEAEDVELARMKKKAKHLKNLSQDMSAETDSEAENVELARMKKKAKHLKNLSQDMSAETDSEAEDVELARMKKKAKHLKNLSQDMSAETDSEAEDVELARMKKKAKHLKNLSQDMSAETDSEAEDVELARMKKKAKHLKNLSQDMSAEIGSETKEVDGHETSSKKRRKAKSKRSLGSDASSDRGDVELSKVDRVKSLSKKKRKSESKKSLDKEEASDVELFTNSNEQQATEDLELDDMKVERKNLPGKKGKSKFKRLQALLNVTPDPEQGDDSSKNKSKRGKSEVDDFFHEEDTDMGRKSHKSRNKYKDAADLVESDKDPEPPKPKKAVVASTKAIRFSDLLQMQSEQNQPKGATRPHVPQDEQEVDGFFVSKDGWGDFMARVPQRDAVNQEKRNKQLEEIRAQYLKEFGAVPNRTELRRIEREGLRNSKIFHKLIVKESVPVGRQLGPRVAPRQPARLIVRKPTIDDIPEHPSWEAKKKAKEMLMVPFQGKKITFDN